MMSFSSWSPAEWVAHLQLWSYQLTGTILPIGIAVGTRLTVPIPANIIVVPRRAPYSLKVTWSRFHRSDLRNPSVFGIQNHGVVVTIGYLAIWLSMLWYEVAPWLTAVTRMATTNEIHRTQLTFKTASYPHQISFPVWEALVDIDIVRNLRIVALPPLVVLSVAVPWAVADAVPWELSPFKDLVVLQIYS